MFNPQMFQQQAANMNPDMLRNASQMFNNMSDEQIRQYASMSGMGNINPNLIRNSASMMSGMKNEDLKNMTKMAANKYATTQPQAQQQPANNTNKNMNTDNFPQVNRLKAQGNDEFKKQNYEQASTKYFESIMEIEEIWATASYLNNDETRRKELITLESQCRLNYCNAKAKLNDFEVVLTQAQKVLQKEENWKGYFRLGQAQLYLQRYQESFTNLRKAQQMMPTDTTINQLIEEVKQKIESNESQQQKKEENVKVSNPEQIVQKQEEAKESIIKNQVNEQSQQNQSEVKVKQQENKFISDEGPKKPRKTQKLESVDVNSEEFQKKKEILKQKQEIEENQKQQSNEIQAQNKQISQPQSQEKKEGIITEEKEERKTQPPPSFIPTQPSNLPAAMDDKKLQQGMEQFKNMSPEQMKQMTQMMKSMDKNFLRQMMQQQTGMEISESQVEMMQNMISPEMLQTVKDIDPKQLEEIKKKTNIQQPTFQPKVEGQTKEESIPNGQTAHQQQNQPSLSNMMDLAMIKVLFEQLKQNPQMLKSMAGMLGPNHPISGYLNRASPADLQRLVSFLLILLKMVLFFVQLYKAIQKYSVAIIFLLVAYIIFR